MILLYINLKNYIVEPLAPCSLENFWVAYNWVDSKNHVFKVQLMLLGVYR